MNSLRETPRFFADSTTSFSEISAPSRGSTGAFPQSMRGVDLMRGRAELALHEVVDLIQRRNFSFRGVSSRPGG